MIGDLSRSWDLSISWCSPGTPSPFAASPTLAMDAGGCGVNVAWRHRRRIMRVLGAGDVRAALSMPLAIAAMRQAFAALQAGRAALPLRTSVELGAGEQTMLVMPAALAPAGERAVRHEAALEALARTGALGAKLVTVVPGNAAHGLPRVQGVVVLVDAENGRPVALLDGTSLTAIRTGAVSGLATDLLARADAATLAVFGAGAQARTQLEAIATVRTLERVTVFDPTTERADRLAAELAGVGPIPLAIEVVGSAREAVRGADIVCAATSSTTPVFNGADVRPGTHVNGIGSYTLAMRELDPGLLRYARVVVDQRTAALAEAGEVAAAIASGELSEDDLFELGEVLQGLEPGRRGRDEITVFKSVGLAIQDLAAASAALTRAVELDLGSEIELE